MTLSLGPSNFITDLDSSQYIPFFLCVEKTELYDDINGTPQFKYMKPNTKSLIQFFSYITYCFDGKILFCYLEQEFIANQASVLTPPLRCALCSGYVFIFLLNKEMVYTDGQFYIDELIGVDVVWGPYRHRLIASLKRFIAYHMEIVSASYLVTLASDVDEVFEKVFQQINWSTGKPRQSITQKFVHSFSGKLFKDSPVGVRTDPITIKSFLKTVILYFYGNGIMPAVDNDGDEMDVHGPLCDPDFIIWSSLKRFLNIDDHPIYMRFKRANASAVVINAIDGIRAGEYVECNDLLIFQYSDSDFFTKHNFSNFETVPVCGYPFVNQNNILTPIKTLNDYKDHIIRSNSCANDDIETVDVLKFRSLFPHLANLKEVLADMHAADPTVDRSLAFKILLFKKMIFKNLIFIQIDPIKEIYTKLTLNMHRSTSPFAAFSICNVYNTFLCSPNSSMCVKILETKLLKAIFQETFQLTRLKQAVVTFNYILFNSAPRWSISRLMLINHTAAGKGKSHTNIIMRLLFDIRGLFPELSNFSNMSFKYQAANIGKILLMDDVGFSSTQQRTMTSEDNIIPAQFKCILDKGYTVSNVVENDKTTCKNVTRTILSVHNIGFIWNTNTLSHISEAWQDRSVVLGNEPTDTDTPFTCVGVSALQTKVVDMKYDKICERLFLRQHFIQTIIYILTPHGSATKLHMDFLHTLLTLIHNRYPTVTDSKGSLLREQFKILDIAIGDALKNAIISVFDLWIPPWTDVPDILENETVQKYMSRLHRARYHAMAFMDWPQITIECLAAMQVLLPSALVQSMLVVFDQNISDDIQEVERFIRKIVLDQVWDCFKIERQRLIIEEPCKVDVRLNHKMSSFTRALKINIPSGAKDEGSPLIMALQVRDGHMINMTFSLTMILNISFSAFANEMKPLIDQLLNQFMTYGSDEVPQAAVPQHVVINTASRLHTILRFFARLTNVGTVTERGTGNFVIHNDFCGVGMESMRLSLLKCKTADERTAVTFRHRNVIHTNDFHSERFIGTDDVVDVDALMKCKYILPHITTFGDDFINVLKINEMFDYSPIVMRAKGVTIDIMGGDRRARNRSSWEYECAQQIYGHYMEQTPPLQEVFGDLNAMCASSTVPNALASRDGHFKALIERRTQRVIGEDGYRQRYGVASLYNQTAARATTLTPPPADTPPSTSMNITPMPSPQTPGSKRAASGDEGGSSNKKKMSLDCYDLLSRINKI